MAQKIWIGIALLMVILTSSIYFMMPDNVRIDIGKTNTEYSVWENGEWVHSATEYLNLFDGTKKMRAKSRTLTYDIGEQYTIVNRTSVWKDNITTIGTYTFLNNAENVEQVPIDRTLQCINCVGKIVHFEFRDLLYNGITRTAISPETFGHRMKVEWDIENSDHMWAKIYQQKSSDKMIIRYRSDTSDELYSVRMFDPITTEQATTVPTPTAENSEDIAGYCNVTTDGENITYDYKWYKDTLLQTSGDLGYWVSPCYQEQVNYSTFNDGGCDLNYTGNTTDLYTNYSGLYNDELWSVYPIDFSFPLIETWIPPSNANNASYWVYYGDYFGSYYYYIDVPDVFVNDSVKIRHRRSCTGLCTWYRYHIDAYNWSSAAYEEIHPGLKGAMTLNYGETAMVWNTQSTYAPNISRNINTLSSTATTPGDNWTFGCRGYNETDYSAWENATDVEIGKDYTYCYQEFANVSTTCGGLDTGAYNRSGNWSDGNWSTNETEGGEVNYTIPLNFYESAFWLVEDATSERNLTIPSACLTEDKFQGNITISSPTITYECYNNTAWETITTGTEPIFEEAINWGEDVVTKATYTTPTGSILDSTDVEAYCQASDMDGDDVGYYYKWYKDGVLNRSNTSGVNIWTENASVVSGLPFTGTSIKPTVWYDGTTRRLITGVWAGIFFGYQWNGTDWNSNATLINGLGDVISYSTPYVFNDSGTLKLITGNVNGIFFGFQWNGTGWDSNVSIISGLGDVGEFSNPVVWFDGSNWNLISGERYGDWFGFTWNSTDWNSNTSLIEGLEDVGFYSAPEIYNDSGTWKLITGEHYGNFIGYQWNDNRWVNNENIIYGLPDVGDGSSAAVFNDSGTWELITGEQPGAWTGFYLDINAPYTENTFVNVDNLSSSETTIGENWTFSCKGTDGTSEHIWLNATDVEIVPTIVITGYSPTNGSVNVLSPFNIDVNVTNYGGFENNITLYFYNSTDWEEEDNSTDLLSSFEYSYDFTGVNYNTTYEWCVNITDTDSNELSNCDSTNYTFTMTDLIISDIRFNPVAPELDEDIEMFCTPYSYNTYVNNILYYEILNGSSSFATGNVSGTYVDVTQPAYGAHYWKFNGNINNEWGTSSISNVGTVFNSTDYAVYNTTGNGTSASIDYIATTDYTYLLSSPEADLLTDEFAYSLWFKSESTAGNVGGRIITRDASDYWAAYVDQSGAFDQTITIAYGPSASWTATVNSSWHHLVYTENATDTSWYLDGVLEDTAANVADLGTVRAIILGDNTEAAPTPAVSPFLGKIDEVKLFNSSLDLSQVVNLYNQNTVVGLGTGVTSGDELLVTSIPYTATAAGETWTAKCKLSNTTYNSSWFNDSVSLSVSPITTVAEITPDPAYNNDLLLMGNCTGTDTDTTNIGYYYSWYNNSVLYSSGKGDERYASIAFQTRITGTDPPDGPSYNIVKGDYLYVNDRANNAITIWNISDIDNIAYVSNYSNATNLNGIVRFDISADENYLFATAETSDSFSSYNITNKSNITLLDIETYVGGKKLNGAFMVKIKNTTTAYVTSRFSDSLAAWDISDPTALVETAYISTGTFGCNAGWGVACQLNGANQIQLNSAGDTAYVASTSDDCVGIYNVSDINNMSMTDYYTANDYVYGVALDEDRDVIYVLSDVDEEVQIVNVSDITNMSYIANYSHVDLTSAILLEQQDGIVFVGTNGDDSFLAIDMRNTSDLKLDYSLTGAVNYMTTPLHAWPTSTNVFVSAADSDAINVFDITNEGDYTQGESININNMSGTLTTDNNWTLSCLAYSAGVNASWLNSSNVTILEGFTITHTDINFSLWDYDPALVDWTQFPITLPGIYAYTWNESQVEPINQSTIGYSYMISNSNPRLNSSYKFRNNVSSLTTYIGTPLDYYDLWYSMNDSYSSKSALNNTYVTRNISNGTTEYISFYLDANNANVSWNGTSSGYQNLTGDFNISMEAVLV